MRTSKSAMWAVAGVAAALAGGCDDLGVGPEGDAKVALSFTTAAPTGASRALAAAVPVSDGSGRTLDIQRVVLLLKEVELKRAEDDLCTEEDDACEEFSTGPTLVNLPVNGGVVTPFTAPIPPDTYRELELRIHEPEDDNGDRARFLAANPEWKRKNTVRVTGTFDAGAGPQPFDVFLDVNAKVERELNPPVEVKPDTNPASINLTVAVDLASWFRTEDGRLIDPRALATDRKLLKEVEKNVERSFRALRDDDRDGREDRRR